MKRSVAFLLLFFVCSSSSAEVSFFTGNDLLAVCEKKTSIDNEFCGAYIIGAFDSISSIQAMMSKNSSAVCAPENVTPNQLVKIFTKYANQNPEETHLTAGKLILFSLVKAFPCK